MWARVVNGFCFWLLTGLAFALFASAVVLPHWREYRQHKQIEQEMEQALGDLQARADDNARQIEQLRKGDPLILEKLARQVLNYRIEGGQPVQFKLVEPAEPERAQDGPGEQMLLAGRRDAGDPAVPLASPETLRKLENPRVQILLLIMAGVAICMAFIFFGVPPPRKRGEQSPSR